MVLDRFTREPQGPFRGFGRQFDETTLKALQFIQGNHETEVARIDTSLQLQVVGAMSHDLMTKEVDDHRVVISAANGAAKSTVEIGCLVDVSTGKSQMECSKFCHGFSLPPNSAGRDSFPFPVDLW